MDATTRSRHELEREDRRERMAKLALDPDVDLTRREIAALFGVREGAVREAVIWWRERRREPGR